MTRHCCTWYPCAWIGKATSFEREYLVTLLKQTQGNVTRAAQLAKRNCSEFYSLLHRHHLDPALFKTPRE